MIDKCPEIKELNIANNLLTDTSFLNDLNSEKLIHLSIHSNNFHVTADDSAKKSQGLEFLSKFINLEKLFLDNHGQEKLNKGEYNRFTGSLQPLQNLNKYEISPAGCAVHWEELDEDISVKSFTNGLKGGCCH